MGDPGEGLPTERHVVCPSCHYEWDVVPYDIGSGPEVCCIRCDWCFGADGQTLKPTIGGITRVETPQEPPGSGYTGECNLCPHSEVWSTEEASQAAMVWHVHDEHFRYWHSIVGSRVPRQVRPQQMTGVRKL